jgi:trimeric autotransporter adhesin
MANKKVSQLVSKPSVLVTDLFPIADPTTGQLFKTTISDLGTAIGSGVSSVNTLVGAVVLDTDDIQELASPTNRWFTDTRARAALSASSPLAYNSGTGVFSIAQANGSTNGFLSSADWTTFNAKQAALSGTGFVKISGTTISYDNSTYALDSAVVKLTGTQSISGVKTFNSQPVFGNTVMLQNTASGTVLFGGYTTLWTTDSALTVLVGTASSTTIGFSLLYDSSAQRSYTMPTSNGTLALTSQLSAYLPLGGGTMTGVLFGASASFSGFVGFGGNTSPLAAVDVTGAGIFSSSVRSSGYYLTGMTAGSGALYYSSGANRVTVANYNASGIVSFEVNGGNTALTLNSNLSATFANTITISGNVISNGGVIAPLNGGSIEVYNTGNSNYFDLKSVAGNFALRTNVGAGAVNALTIASGGAATFSSSVTVATFLRASAGAQSNPTGGASVAIDYQSTSDIQGRIRSRDWDGAAWKNLTIEANNIILSPAGNVGIGTTAPTTGLGWSRVLDLTGTGSSAFVNRVTGSTQESIFGTDGAGLYIDVTGAATASNNKIIFRTVDVNSSVNATERMRIKSNGIINFSNVPSSASGLSSGDIYKTVAGVLMIV